MERRLVLDTLGILLLLLALPHASGGDDLYIAFGDSITRSTGGPANPHLVFDGGACSDSNLSECACARRLTDDLAGDALVVNEGIGAERTDAGLARLDSVLDTHCSDGDPGECIALLLMEGTNNVTQILKGKGGYSIESTIQDLESMIDVAAMRGVDVLLSAIPQRAEWNGCDAIGHDETTEELNVAIEALAADAGRPFADVAHDPQDGLCDDSNACFENHYFCDDLHLDGSGYNRLCDVFLDSIESKALPGAPTPTAPTGVTTMATADFEWPELSRATWYQLEVDGDSSWHDAGICSAGTCSVAPYTLPEGNHSWRVRARNLLGYGPWSGSVDFALYLSVPQTAPEPLSPDAPIFETKPLYRWQEVGSAETYSFEVKDSSESVVVTVTELPASDFCASGSCSYREGTTLAVDTYSWTILATNPLGVGPTSNAVGFEILECTNDSPRDVEALLPSPVQGTATVSWCGPLTAGALGPYIVEAAGDLTLHSRDSVQLLDGFEASGRLEIRVDR